MITLTSSRQHIHALQNSWHGHTTLHTSHHKHATLSSHRRCKRTLHSLALVIWWPQRATNSRCHQQLGPHNTKHNHTNQSAKHHTTTNLLSDITPVSNTLYNRTSSTTQHALSSVHLPIILTINIWHDYRLQQNRQTSLAALTRYFPASLVAPVSNSEQINNSS